MNAKNAFCEYFRQGATEKQHIGLEIEHFVMKNGRPLGYYEGMRDIMGELSQRSKQTFCEGGNLLGCDFGSYALSLEPGSQLEVSVSPMQSAAEILEILNGFYKTVTPAAEQYGVELVTIPVLDEKLLAGVELLPKKRYEFMDDYFKESGTMGRYMMRGTASAQVSVDYENETDFVKKFRAAYLLSPLFAYIMANDGENYLKRIEIWNNTDKIRTAVPKSLFSDDFGFVAYADELMKVPAIFVPCNGEYIYTPGAQIGELCGKYGYDKGMIEHYLSMVFPDVRLKNYIEIRIADTAPAPMAAAYAGLVKSIFYTDALNYVLERYKEVSVDDIVDAKAELSRRGETVYGRNIREETEYLFDLAAKYGSVEEFNFLAEMRK